MPLNYIGYVEGRDIFNGKVDVVVCDGFTGNVALKTMEGVASFAGEVLKSAFKKSVSSQLGYLMSRKLAQASLPPAGLCRIRRRAADRFGRRRDHRPWRVKSAGNQKRHSRCARRGRSEDESPYRRGFGERIGSQGHRRRRDCRENSGDRLKSKIESIGDKGDIAERARRNGGEVASGNDRICFSRSGIAIRRHGQRVLRTVSSCHASFCRSRRCPWFFAQPALFSRPGSGSQAHGKYPAGDSGRVDRGVARSPSGNCFAPGFCRGS